MYTLFITNSVSCKNQDIQNLILNLSVFSVYDQGALYHSSLRLVEANQTKQDQTEGNKGLIAKCFGKTFLRVVIKRNNIQLTTSKTDNSVWQLCKGLPGLASINSLSCNPCIFVLSGSCVKDWWGWPVSLTWRTTCHSVRRSWSELWSWPPKSSATSITSWPPYWTRSVK